MISSGEMINHYKILRSIGKGGMGEVFLAEDTVLERQVAIKFLPEKVYQDPSRRKRFLREAKAAAGLDHPNICQVYETNESEGRSFIVMEYVAGETLAQRQSGGTERVLQEQLKALLDVHASRKFQKLLIAYEPVWAIGTGKVATIEEIDETHKSILAYWEAQTGASAPPILYGGSVAPDNYGPICNIPSVGGALVGGASLSLEKFSKLVEISETA